MPEEDHSDMDEYLTMIAKRIARLEVTAEEMQDKIEEQNEDIRNKGRNFKKEITDFRNEVKDLENQAQDLSKTVSKMVEDFKRVSRKPMLERLQRKIDDWSPEHLATHKDLERALEKLNQ